MAAYFRMLLRDKAALLSVLFLVFIVLATFGGGLFIGDDALAQNLRARLRPPFAPDAAFGDLLGTDLLGRGVLERMILAGQISLGIAFVSAIIAAAIGSAIGIAAGYRGGAIDAVAMRGADVIMSFPNLLLAILFLYLLTPRPENIILLLVIGRLPLYVRVTRAATLELRNRLFVDAARCLGASAWSICRREIAPVVLPTVLTLVALDVGFLMLLESALSFLGLGIQPPQLSWGGMVAEGRRWISTGWWLTFFPGLMIFLTALSCNLFSNWLRLATDPMQRWRLEKGRRDTSPAPAKVAAE